MKKGIKITLIVIGCLVGIVLLDSLQALIFNNNPIIGIETHCRRKAGILVDTFHCGNGKNVTKFKTANSCPPPAVCGNDTLNTDKKIEVVKSSTQDLNKFNIYLERDERIIYLSSSLDEIYYNSDGNIVTLKEYISKAWQTTDDGIKHLTDLMENTETLKDGGTKIYKSNAYNITIIKCNTVSGNHDYFIGDYDMTFDNDSMCRR